MQVLGKKERHTLGYTHTHNPSQLVPLRLVTLPVCSPRTQSVFRHRKTNYCLERRSIESKGKERMARRGKEWLTSERVAKEQPGIRDEERVEEMRGGERWRRQRKRTEFFLMVVSFSCWCWSRNLEFHVNLPWKIVKNNPSNFSQIHLIQNE